MKTTRALFGAGVAAALLFGACEERVVAPADVARVELDPEVLSLRVGGTSQFEANIFDSQGNALTGRDVSWSIEDPSVGAVAENGTVIATAIGQTRVFARSGGQQGTATLRVTSNTVASVEVVPAEASVEFGSTRTFEVVVRATDGTTIPDRTATWTSGATGVAAVNSEGTVTGVGLGSTTIEAVVDGVRGEAIVAIVAPPLTGLSVEPGTAALQVGQQRQLTAVGQKADGSAVPGLPVAWRSLDPDVATVDGNGLVTAVFEGEARIEAGFGRHLATTTISVSPVPAGSIEVLPEAPAILVNDTLRLAATVRSAEGVVLDRVPNWASRTPEVASVDAGGLVTGLTSGFTYVVAELDGARDSALVRVALRPIERVVVLPDESTIRVDESVQLSAQVISDDGSQQNREITWLSADPDIATVSGSGRVTGVRAGTAVIRATAGGVTGTAVVNVNPPPIVSIRVRPSSVQLEPGQTASFSAVGVTAGGVEVPGLGFSWRTSNGSIATVSGGGTVTAVALGETQVIASAQGIEGSATVRVVPPPITRIEVSPSSTPLLTGETATLTARAYTAAGNEVSGVNFSWKSSNTGVATVSGGNVTAVGPGSATITASAQGVDGTASVTVQNPEGPVKIDIVGSDFTLTVGASRRLSATIRDADGNPFAGNITWQTKASSVASVSSSGLVRGRGVGATYIVAFYKELRDSVQVTVVASPIVSLDLEPSSVSLEDGETRTLTVVGTRENGEEVTGLSATWSSGNSEVATVNGSGTVTGEGSGTTEVRATYNGMTAAASVTVEEDEPAQAARIELSSTFEIIEEDDEITLKATVYDNAGNVLDRDVVWSSSASAIASVNDKGKVEGESPGIATIRASVDGVTASALIIVVDD